ncbi:MAG: aminomethyl-transferring glycine dehydrogenase subunit GcvPA [Acidobacteria bacterium]|nr:aminomethyl-transferring glycine dehydrogenase subunit GcvPA [Acidobacteriota bacterium]
MKYLPNSGKEFDEILKEIGVGSVDELFKVIPEELRLTKPLDLPEGKSEVEVLDILRNLSDKTAGVSKYSSFLGAGAYNHYVPTTVGSLISRAEFYTAYTPYQPEVSQGTLLAMFEYQTMMCHLTGMEIANASLYDGASATAEAVLMADRIQRKKNKIVMSEGIHPEYLETVKTYLWNLPIEIVTVPLQADGSTDMNALKNAADDSTAIIMAQSPNFFGVIENIEAIAGAAKEKKILFGQIITEVYSLGMLKAPGAFGVDIVVGEAQSMGNKLNYGGPYLGFIATTDDLKRQLPGRLIGMTKDNRDQRGFVITLSTREQHIRREKATSNICTNEALCATMAAIHMSTIGEAGVKEVAEHCHSKAVYAHQALEKTGKVKFPHSGPYFNEFVVDVGKNGKDIVEKLTEKKIIAGFPLIYYYPERENQILMAFTELNTKEQIDRLAAELGGAL